MIGRPFPAGHRITAEGVIIRTDQAPFVDRLLQQGEVLGLTQFIFAELSLLPLRRQQARTPTDV